MMKYFIIFLLLLASPAYSSTGLPWSQTYDDCPVWNQYSEDITTGPLPCGGLSKGGSGQATPGTHSTSSGTLAYYEQIISDANYSGGLGGYGQRHWWGNNGDTAGNNSGATDIYLDTPASEVWVRFYMRFEDGFSGKFSQMKNLFFWGSTGSGGFQIGYPGIGGMRFWATTPEANCSNCGWDNSFYTVDQDADGIGDSDGSWHLFEVHVKLSTGVTQVWVDEVLKINETGASFSLTDIDQISIGSNSKYITNSPVIMYNDMDDFVISTTGYIGPVAGGSSGSGGTAAGSGSISAGSGSFQ